MKKAFDVLVVGDYYLASILMLVAGVLKVGRPGLGDILEYFLEHEILELSTIIAVSRNQPWLEIAVGAAVLAGWRAEWAARLLGGLYLFFILLIVYVSEGNLMMPLDCGCFGEGEDTVAYLLVLRNAALAFPLFFFGTRHRPYTLPGLFRRARFPR